MRIDIKNLKKSYQGKCVLDIDKLSFPSGSIIAIVGANGAGKSTLLNLIGNLTEKDAGCISYDGALEPPMRDMTLVFQQPYLMRTSVRENIAYPLKIRRKDKQEIEAVVQKLSDALGLGSLLNKMGKQLSLGEAQKVAFARALSFEPKLLLLDEPCASIDPHTNDEIEKILKNLNKEKKTTILIVTHNLAQAGRLADEVVLLNHGKVIEYSPVQKFFNAPTSEMTKRFIEREMLI